MLTEQAACMDYAESNNAEVQRVSHFVWGLRISKSSSIKGNSNDTYGSIGPKHCRSCLS